MSDPSVVKAVDVALIVSEVELAVQVVTPNIL
jgi:hypothetical protein